MRTLRRFLVLFVLSFWQGGFLFYASVVVPIATEELGNSPLRQGFITRRVTGYLNLAGAVSLAFLAWDAWATADRSRLRARSRGALWLLMALAQVGLFSLHATLDGMMQRKGLLLLDPDNFRPYHRLYLWVQTVQWAAALLFLLLSVPAWKGEDEQGAGGGVRNRDESSKQHVLAGKE